ncbi:MAG: OsmC family protein [Terriglobales bacterium]
MADTYEYEVIGRWSGSRGGTLESHTLSHVLEFSAPPEFQGRVGFWTPEHFLVGAVASCFISTFAAVAEMSKLEVVSLRVGGKGVLEKVEGGGYRFTEVVLYLELAIARSEDRERAQRLIEKAERGCLIARSLSSKVTTVPAINVSEPVAAD